ncbi:hypothetical protein EDD18DRAFT_1427406 [Armillaria luteobubalina]|uniref:Uncharacterized protein n=1 Tax=Armillaria luteobubalina TaxID=153913 RepID=A0AA39V215_9AGAR|nr:hypothetical protein EDD18DRAFT_1427406 [Armillaria luteobubalina]
MTKRSSEDLKKLTVQQLNLMAPHQHVSLQKTAHELLMSLAAFQWVQQVCAKCSDAFRHVESSAHGFDDPQNDANARPYSVDTANYSGEGYSAESYHMTQNLRVLVWLSWVKSTPPAYCQSGFQVHQQIVHLNNKNAHGCASTTSRQRDMSIEVHIATKMEASFEQHFIDEAQDLFNTVDKAIAKTERSGTLRKYYRIDCIVCELIIDSSQHNMARFLSPSGCLLGTLYYSGNCKDAEYIAQRGPNYALKNLPHKYLGKLLYLTCIFILLSYSFIPILKL